MTAARRYVPPHFRSPQLKGFTMKGSLRRVLLLPAVLATASVVLAACGSSGAATPAASSSGAGSGSSSGALKTGLKVFVIPKNLGNPYFTTSDSVKSGGALAALQTLGETGSETSGLPDPRHPGGGRQGR